MTWLRDFLRGYSDADIVSACRKYNNTDEVELFTKREEKAYCEEGITFEYAKRILKSADTIEKLK